MLELSESAVRELRDQLLTPAAAIDAIRLSLPVIATVCDRAAREFSEDEGDDANLFGQQCSRRSRNLIARVVQDAQLAEVVVRRPRGSLVVIAAGTRVYFWAAGDASGSPRLTGGHTKPEILDACVRQLAIWETTPVKAPSHLVVAYRATPSANGLVKVVAGVPRAADQWDRAVEVFDETGAYDAPLAVRPKEPVSRFDVEQPPAPVIQLRPREERGES